MNATMITIEEVKMIETKMKRRLARLVREESGRDWERLWREQKGDYRKLVNFVPTSTNEQTLLSHLVNIHENIREGVTAMTGKVH